MNIRPVIIIATTAALVVLAFLGGKMVRDQPASRLKPSEGFPASSRVEQLELIYPKNEAGERPIGTPAKSFVVRGGAPSYMSSIGRLSRKLNGVELSAEQIAQMQDVYTVVFEGRQKYELANARVGKTAAGTVIIEIPSYEVFGSQLRSTLVSAFESILGHKKAKAIESQIGSQIDVENTYWGKYPQVIQADFDPSNKHYQIATVINPTPANPDAFSQAIGSDLSGDHLDNYSIFGELLAVARK